MNRRYRPFAYLLLILAMALGGGSLLAKPRRPSSAGKKGAPPVPPPSNVAVPTAHLRWWKVADIPATPPPNLRISPFTKPAASNVLVLQPGRYDFQNYIEVPSGVLTVEVAPPDDKAFATPQKTNFFLNPGGAATLLIRQTLNGATTLEVIDDSVPALGDLTIFNFLPPALGEVQVSMGDTLSARLAPSTGRVRMRGLSRQTYSVAAVVKASDGRSERWNNEIDFRSYHRAWLILCVDSYDRIRGRVISAEAPKQ